MSKVGCVALGAVARAEVEAGLDRFEQLVAIRLGDAEQDADHLHRQLGRDLDEEVDRLAVGHRVEERAGAAAQLVLQVAHGQRREALAHEPADPRRGAGRPSC